jgi:hypothetical protein
MHIIIDRIREKLLGRYFSTRSELRHLAEGAGFNFVPVEILTSEDRNAVAVLRPKGLGEILVRAERPVAWQPFHIIAVEAA